MPDSSTIRVPLTELMSLLEKAGFEISTRTVLDIQKVLANLDEISKEETASLKLLLGPLICRNKEEQEKFYTLFDAYEKQLHDYTTHTIEKIKKDKEIEDIRVAEETKKAKQRRRIRNALLVSLSILLLAAGAWYYFFHKNKTKEPNLSITYDVKKIKQEVGDSLVKPASYIVTGDTVTFTAVIDDTIAGKDYNISLKINEELFSNTRTVTKIFNKEGDYQALAYLIPQKKNSNSAVREFRVLCEDPPPLSIQKEESYSSDSSNVIRYKPGGMDAARGNFKYEWLVNDTLRYNGEVFEYPPAGLTRKITLRATGKIKQECADSVYEYVLNEAPKLILGLIGTQPLHLSPEFNNDFLTWMVIITLFSVAFIYYLFYRRKLKKIMAKFISARSTDDIPKLQPDEYIEPYHIQFKPQEIKIPPQTAISQLAETMRKRHVSDVYYLHIGKTIRSSIKKAGFPVFEFIPRTQPSDFLIFVDKEYPDSHLVKLYNYVLGCLKNEQVNYTAYSFAQHPLFLSNESLNHLLIPIDKISRLYPKTILFLFADPSCFFKPLDNTLHSWAIEKFKAWESKIIFTSVPEKDWGKREKILYQAGFTVVPADVNAHRIVADEINNMIDRQRLKKAIVPEAYAARHVNFNNWVSLKKYLEEASTENNKELNEATDFILLKEWVSATAVFPYVNWDVTIAIGKALETLHQAKGKLVNYTNLLLLGRIQWMKDGQMPDSLRIEMLKELGNENEIAAREAVSGLLEEITNTIPADSAVYAEYELQKITNRFLVHQFRQHDIDRQDKDFIAVKNFVENDKLDWPVDIYLNDEKANTVIKDGADSSQSIPIGKFIDKVEIEGAIEDERKESELKRRKNKLKWSTAGLIGSVIIAGILSLIYGFKITPTTYPATADRKIIISNSGSFININSDLITVKSGNKVFETEKLGDTAILVKDFPTGNVAGNLDLATQNANAGDQNFPAVLLPGFENYVLTLGTNEKRTELRIFYSNEQAYSKFKLDNNFILSDNIYKITAQQGDSAEPQPDKKYIGKIRLQYWDDGFQGKADTMRSSFQSEGFEFIPEKITDTTQPATLYIQFPVITEPPPCLKENLPATLTEIWKGGSSNRLININTSNNLIYYSTGDKKTYGTYRISDICNSNGIYRVITEAEDQFKVFFIKDFNPSSGFSLSVCESFYKTIEEAQMLTEANCDVFNTMRLYYEGDQDPNKIFLPVGSNGMETNNRAKLEGIKARIKKLETDGIKYDISRQMFENLLVKGISPPDLPAARSVSSAQIAGTPFDRAYLIYNIKSEPSPCSRTFKSIAETKGVKPESVCRLDLSRKNLETLPPELRSFTKLKFLNISENYLPQELERTLVKMFPEAEIHFQKQLTKPDCNRTFTSMKEALSVDPAKICRLDLSREKLQSIPLQLKAFVNLQWLDISNNNLSAGDRNTLTKMFPRAEIIPLPPATGGRGVRSDQGELHFDSKYRPDDVRAKYLVMMKDVLNKNPQSKIEFTVYTDRAGSEKIALETVNGVRNYLNKNGWGDLLKSGRVTVVKVATSPSGRKPGINVQQNERGYYFQVMGIDLPRDNEGRFKVPKAN